MSRSIRIVVSTALIVSTALLACTQAHAAPTAIWFLPPGASAALDTTSILEAVSIYTRDLGLTVERGSDAPSTVAAESLAEVVALVRSRDLRLAFWYTVRDPERDVILYAVTNAPSGADVHALKVADVGTPELYRAMALKVRAVLTGTARLEPQLQTPALPPSPPAARPPATSSPPQSAAGPTVPPVRPANARRWVSIAVAYRLTLPIDRRLLRHGVVVEASVPFAKHFELSLGIDLTSESRRTLPEGRASLFDLPVRVGVRGVLHGRRLAIGAGPLVSLHVLSVSAVGFDSTRGDALAVAAGIGGEVAGRLRLNERFSLELRLLAEAIVPRTKFSLHGATSVETGSALFGLRAGMLFDLP